MHSLPIAPPGVYTPIYIYIHRTERGDGTFSHKKKEILSFLTTWIDFKGAKLSEINQRQIPYDLTYMWVLKTNKKQLQEQIGGC